MEGNLQNNIRPRRTVEEEARIIEGGAGKKEKLLKLAIAEATDLRALYYIIQNNGGIQGSQKHYSPEEITKLIERVQQGADPNLLTSAFGLRQKVQYFISMNKVK